MNPVDQTIEILETTIAELSFVWLAWWLEALGCDR